MTSRES